MKNKILNQIKDYFTGIKEVAAVYLFGSVATDKEIITSDIMLVLLMRQRQGKNILILLTGMIII